jgi:hypothetical protein
MLSPITTGYQQHITLTFSSFLNTHTHTPTFDNYQLFICPCNGEMERGEIRMDPEVTEHKVRVGKVKKKITITLTI